MKNSRIIILVIVFAVVAYYARIIIAAKSLTFSTGRASNFRFEKGFVTWKQIINATNGEGVSIPITSANIQPYINATAIGKTILIDSQTILARGTTGLEFTIVIPYTDFIALGFSVNNIISTRNLSITLGGNVRALGVTVPINEEFKIDFKTIL